MSLDDLLKALEELKAAVQKSATTQKSAPPAPAEPAAAEPGRIIEPGRYLVVRRGWPYVMCALLPTHVRAVHRLFRERREARVAHDLVRAGLDEELPTGAVVGAELQLAIAARTLISMLMRDGTMLHWALGWETPLAKDPQGIWRAVAVDMIDLAKQLGRCGGGVSNVLVL